MYRGRGPIGHRLRVGAVAMVVALIGPVGLMVEQSAAAGTSTSLTRYPYLTDSIQNSITINWATDTSDNTASVTWGPPGSCAASEKSATRTSITVMSRAEYQWAATIPVAPDTTYCYRVLLGGTDLLGSDPSPVFTSQVAAGSTAPFAFDVFGDWGQAYANGNPDQTNVLQQMATSGARFAVMTGDTAYPSGGQAEYGDLQQSGVDRSTVFGPTFWAVPGRSLPVFNVTGNHGFTNGAAQVINWPETNAAAASGGMYAMQPYPSINGTAANNYPSMWYAFDAGVARFYVLTAAWSDANNGTANVYQNDRDQHWSSTSAEYQWLEADLAAHPSGLKFAFWHYPLYADAGGQSSDSYLQGGAGTLQGLLDRYHVAVVFNGHAHGYERNKPDGAGMISYVLGNGGAAMGSVGGCSPIDAYAIGSGGSHCGAAPAGQSLDHVFGFAKVTVTNSQVTVTPTDEMGRTFDVQTYTFGPAAPPPPITPPAAPTNVSAAASGPTSATLTWSVPPDDGGAPITGYTATAAPAGPTCSTTGATACTMDGLVPGTTYTFTVVATNNAGPGTASTPSNPVQITVPTTLTLDTAPASVPAGSQITLAGTVARSDTSAALPGRVVGLQSRWVGSTGPFVTAATATSSATGAVTFPGVVVSRSTQYCLSTAPDTTYEGATSPPSTVLALRSIEIGASTPMALVGHTFAIGGTVAPASPGTKILLQRKFGTNWATRASTLLSKTSQYLFTLRPRARGTLTYRAVTLADTAYGRSTSRVLTLTVSAQRNITITPTVRSTVVGRGFAIHGVVRPASPGTKILLQRKFGTAWRTTAATRLSSTSRYRFAIPPRPRGKMIYRTYVRGNRSYVTSISPTATVIVR